VTDLFLPELSSSSFDERLFPRDITEILIDFSGIVIIHQVREFGKGIV